MESSFFAFFWFICYSYKRVVGNIIASNMPFKWSESCYIDFGNQSFKGQILFLAFIVITLGVKVFPDCSCLICECLSCFRKGKQQYFDFFFKREAGFKMDGKTVRRNKNVTCGYIEILNTTNTSKITLLWAKKKKKKTTKK